MVEKNSNKNTNTNTKTKGKRGLVKKTHDSANENGNGSGMASASAIPISSGETDYGDFFKNLADEDFFSDKVQHIYYKNEVTGESVIQLQQQIRAANMSVLTPDGIQTSPKPIVIHISSFGGSVYDGMRTMTIFNESRVPICTMIDGFCASAATYLSILAPYRVITEYSVALIHQYKSMTMGTREIMLNNIKETDESFAHISDMYVRKTKIKKAELNELMRHDLWFTAGVCEEKGIVDRVLRFSNSRKKLSPVKTLSTGLLLKKTNLNILYVTCDSPDGNAAGPLENIDAIIQNRNILKPVLFHPAATQYICSNSFEWQGISIIPRMQILSMRVPTYSILDTIISLDDYLPSLFCTKRLMYEHASISINMLYSHLHGLLLHDTIHNTTLLFDRVKGILKAKTKLPAKLIDNIDKQIILLNAKECLKYKLCDEIIRL